MKIKVQIDGKKIANKVINDDVRVFANEDWYKLYEPFVPKRKGILYGDIEITKDYIHHKVPYARRMYYGENFNFNKGQPLATAYWDKVAWESQGDKLIKDIEKISKERGNLWIINTKQY